MMQSTVFLGLRRANPGIVMSGGFPTVRSISTTAPALEEKQLSASAKFQENMKKAAARQAATMDLMMRRKNTGFRLQEFDIAPFATHVRPWGNRPLPPGLTFRDKLYARYIDIQNDVLTIIAYYKIRQLLGKNWVARLNERIEECYIATNKGLAANQFDHLYKYAAGIYIQELKKKAFKDYIPKWSFIKLDSIKRITARMENIPSHNAMVAQVAVRLVSEQSLELKDKKGNTVSDGTPKRVTEYFVMQRKMDDPNDDWRILAKTKIKTNPFDVEGFDAMSKSKE